MDFDEIATVVKVYRRYVKGTIKHCVHFPPECGEAMKGYFIRFYTNLYENEEGF